MPVATLTSLDAWLSTEAARVHVVSAGAPWVAPCTPGGAVDALLDTLSQRHADVLFAKVDVEETPEAVEAWDVTVVPTFLLFVSKQLVDKLEGADAAGLTRRVDHWRNAAASSSATGVSPKPAAGGAGLTSGASAASPAAGGVGGSSALPAPAAADAAATAELNRQLEKLVNAAAVMLFMKGSPEEPRCGFSRKAVQMLRETGITFGSFDVLSNQTVRDGLKKYANWQTYPQLWVNGKLVGGVDIMTELKEAGELASVLPPPAQLEGSKLQPPANTSGAFSATSVPPSASAASSAAGGAPAAAFSMTPELEARLRSIISSAPAVLFMKGTPDEPACGFSARMVNILRDNGITFSSFDILSDPHVRAGLKIFSNWPTYPQLYVNGALVGGVDIIKEMVEDAGEPLATALGLTA